MDARSLSPRPFVLLETLYDEQAGDLYRFFLGMLGRPEDAEDALQALWLELAKKPRRLTTIRDLPAYLWTAARHRARSILRRRALERLLTPAFEDPDGSALFAAAENSGVPAEELRDVARALAGLKPRFREVVLLVGFAGCTLAEAGQRLGVPPGTAASRYRTAIERLKTLLGPGDPP